MRGVRRREFLAGVAGLGATGLVAACGSGAQTSAPGAAPAAARPATAPGATPAPSEQEWERVRAAAKQEGTVAVIATPGDPARRALSRFQEDYPGIRIEINGLLVFEPKVRQERDADQYLWDAVVLGVGPDNFRHVEWGWYEPLKPAVLLPDVLDDSKWLGGFDWGFLDSAKQHLYIFTLDRQSNVFVNNDLVPKGSVRAPEDLLDPRWRGKISWLDPRASGAGAAVLTYFLFVLGEDRLKTLLADQQLVLSQDRRQLAEWLVRGRYPISVGVFRPDLVQFQKEGFGLNVETPSFPREAVTPGPGGVRIMSRAPHPNATKVFLNWLLSQRGQSAWATEVESNSRRLDVPPGGPSEVVDPARLDQYVLLNRDDSIELRARATELAKAHLP
jgi:iron(III) transport system substrate-binding protein